MSEIEKKDNNFEETEPLLDEFNELENLFAKDLELLENEVSISEDLTGFAKGFPNWDLHPPKNLRHTKK